MAALRPFPSFAVAAWGLAVTFYCAEFFGVNNFLLFFSNDMSYVLCYNGIELLSITFSLLACVAGL